MKDYISIDEISQLTGKSKEVILEEIRDKQSSKRKQSLEERSFLLKQMSQLFNVVADTMDEQSRRIKELEERQKQLENRRIYLPEPVKEPISEMHQIIRDFVARNDLKYNEVYRMFYEEFKYYYHIDLLIRAMNSGKRAVDIIRELNKEREALALAKKIFA